MDHNIKIEFSESLKKIISGENISRNEAKQNLIYLLDHKLGIANDACFGAYFAALQTKKQTIDEAAGLMDAVVDYDRKAIDIFREFSDPLCGIIGSGKDDLKTFNISSISSIVAASAGVKTVKNGSRAEASIAGTTDVFEELGVNVLDRDPEILEQSLNKLNFAFCDAQPYFPKMVKEYLGKYFFVHPLSFILPVASGLKFDRVVFGLANDNTEFTAELLIKLGYDNSLVVAGHDRSGKNFDEISNIGPTKISEIKNGEIKTNVLEPKDFGIEESDYQQIKEGESIKENAEIFRNILNNSSTKAQKDIITMNAGALIYISGKSANINEGIEIAKKEIESGKPQILLEKFINLFKNS